MNAPIEEVVNSQILQSVHSISLPRASLPISEDCDGPHVENKVQNWIDAQVIQVFVSFVFCKRIIELEILIVNIFGDPVHFVPTLMHCHHRIRHRDTVYLPDPQFLLKDRSFLNTDADFQLVGRDVL